MSTLPCSYVVQPKEPVDEVIGETERKTDLVVQGSYQVCHNCGVISPVYHNLK